MTASVSCLPDKCDMNEKPFHSSLKRLYEAVKSSLCVFGSLKTVVMISFVIASGGFLFGGCASDKSAEESQGVVATVGSFEISDRHFTNHLKRFYLRTGQAANINEDFRLGVVNARIERYAIVEYAREQGWAYDADARYNREAIERKVLMEAYERYFIHALVQVTDQHMREVLHRYNSSLRASHIRADNRYAADSLYQLLQNGADFADLASRTFRDPALATSGGDLGFFTLDEMDIAFEEQAFNMEIGEISRPVKTSTGYSIIKLTDAVTNPLITETEFARRRNQLAQVARRQQNELATRADMRNIIGTMNWNRELVQELWDIIEKDPSVYQAAGTELRELPLQIDESKRDAVIASRGGFHFTVADFLTEAYYTPPQRRAQARNFYVFEEQLEGLAYRAHALGLINNYPQADWDYINGAKEETFYSYLLSRFDDYLDRQIQIEEELMHRVFNEMPDQFGQPLKLDMAEIVLTDKDLAAHVYNQLVQGASFDRMLQQYGAPVESKERGGQIGMLPIDRFGTMAPQIKNIRPGEVAGPFQVAHNYYVILACMGRTEPRPQSFEEARTAVRDYIFFQERNRLRAEKVLALRSMYNASIDMHRLNSLSFEL